MRAFRARQSKGAPGPRHRSSFRKRSGADTAAASAATELGELPAGKYSVTSTPLLLVDGYNVIGFWPRLKKRRDRDDMEGARRMLLEDLVSYNSPKRYDIVVVFDAVPSPGDRLDAYLGIGVVYTPSADLYIESELRRIAAEGERPVWAATGDRQIQVAASTYGANVMSTMRLVTEIKGSRAATPVLVAEWNRQEAQRRPVFLEDQVDGLGRDLLSGAAPDRKLSQRERKRLQEGGHGAAHEPHGRQGAHAHSPSLQPPPAHPPWLREHAKPSFDGGLAARPIQRRLSQRQRTLVHGRESEGRREAH